MPQITSGWQIPHPHSLIEHCKLLGGGGLGWFHTSLLPLTRPQSDLPKTHLSISSPAAPHCPLGERSELWWRHLVKMSVKSSGCFRSNILGLGNRLLVINHLFQCSPPRCLGYSLLLHPGQYVPLCCCAGSNTGGRAVKKAEQVSRKIQIVSWAKKLGRHRDIHQERKRNVASQYQQEHR